MATVGPLAREQLEHYISKDIAGPYTRLGLGFSSLDNDLSANETTTSYITGSSSTTVTGYTVSWSIDGEIVTGNTANIMLHKMAVNRDKGTDARIYFLNVRRWEDGTISGSYRGYRQACSFSPSSDGGGDADSTVTFSGTLNASGDPVHGDIEITRVNDDGENDTAVFTPDA